MTAYLPSAWVSPKASTPAERKAGIAFSFSFTISYFILMNKGTDGRNRYGVKVRSNDDAVALDLSERSERVFDLLDKLARNTVTPTGLPDVLADWRG